MEIRRMRIGGLGDRWRASLWGALRLAVTAHLHISCFGPRQVA